MIRICRAALFYVGILLGCCLAEAGEPYDSSRFEKEVLVQGCKDAMQIDVAWDGRIFFTEKAGALKMHDPARGETVLLTEIPVSNYLEVGLLGIALSPRFKEDSRFFLMYCPASNREVMRVSRFTLTPDQKFDPSSEAVLLEYPITPSTAAHMGGALAWDPHGNLIIGTGDNCLPIPELPVDQRLGKEGLDALRTSANTDDLRGKVLRIRPTASGGYEIPRGNLFPEGRWQGRPAKKEIYAMGVRNAFRVTADPRKGWIYWGDVGPNIQLDLEIGPNGYDEIHVARKPGNFGHPMFVGPNEPYRMFDFEARRAGLPFDPALPRNLSKNNTGAILLPLPEKPLIWYPSTASSLFPELGSGGRCAMVGPVYYNDSRVRSDLKLPEKFDSALFIFDWTRNWIKAVKLNKRGEIREILPFMPESLFRKPMDLKLGPDHTLYLLEYGDKWVGNQDGQISRIIYRRGNFPPVSKAKCHPENGPLPLVVTFDGSASSDRDPENGLKFRWYFPDGKKAEGIRVVKTFSEPGVHEVRLVVEDSGGLRSTNAVQVTAGNARPKVEWLKPVAGGFFNWNEPVKYHVRVTDREDGDSEEGLIFPNKVMVQVQVQSRSVLSDENADLALHPGLKLMRSTTCFSCHLASEASAGPAYLAVANKYATEPESKERLVRKIIEGGGGAWGEAPMPPHPQHSPAEARLMLDWIFSLRQSQDSIISPGTLGTFTPKPSFSAVNVLVLTATYFDEGGEGVPPLKAESVAVLHARKKKAAFFDSRKGVEVVDVFEGSEGLVARLLPGGYFGFSQMRLDGIKEVEVRAARLKEEDGHLELRSGGPDGTLLASANLNEWKSGPEVFGNIRLPLQKVPDGVDDLFFVVRGKSAQQPLLDVNWIHFH